MVPMTPATSSRRAIAGYQAALVGLDFAGALTIVSTVGGMALVIYNSSRPDFMGGNDGRVLFAALVASLSGYGGNSLFDLFFGGFRDRLVEARVELLIEDAKDARERHSKALAEVDIADPRTSTYLSVLEAAAAKAEDRAQRAGVLPSELS